MRHFVQYHIIDDTQGPPSANTSRIYTRKAVDGLIGDRVWLVSGRGRPRTFELVGSFIVEETGRNPDGTNFARGKTITPSHPPIPIREMDWFPKLSHTTNKFTFGLTQIKDASVVGGLLTASRGNSPATRPSQPDAQGGLFGTPEENAVVEKAAIEAAKRHYRDQGWEVVPHEPLKLGYDLLCTRAAEIQHAEVKGVRGSECSFILTANEKDFAESNESFRLCVVVNALDPARREIHEFTAQEMASRFVFKPLSFVARLKT